MDTNALLWLAFDDDRLGPVARERVTADGSEVWFSPVSIFEIQTKSRLGKLSVPGNVLQHAHASGYGQKPLWGIEAELAGQLDWDHKDPFDRLLVAQTRLLAFEFLTSDREILEFESLAVDARR